MSLLMEALRKAEEAKRRAAQGSEPEKTEPLPQAVEVAKPSAPAENAAPVASSDDLIAALLADDSLALPVTRVTAPSNDLFAESPGTATSGKRADSSALDIPLGFSLDEEPAVVAPKALFTPEPVIPAPVAREPAALGSVVPETAIPQPVIPEPIVFETIAPVATAAESVTPELIAFKPSIPEPVIPVPAIHEQVPAQVKPAEPESPALSFGDDIFASLKLADAPPVAPQQEMTDFLLELAVHSTEPKKPEIHVQAPEPAPAPAPTPAPEIEFDLLPAVAPGKQEMFAERETTTAPASASKQPATTLSQAKANKFKDALAAKKSVRALFASKTKTKSKPQFNSKSKLTPQKRLFVLGSAAALATVVIIGGWLVLSMMSGTGNQYVIPPLSDNVPLGAPITIPATEVAAADAAAPEALPAEVLSTDVLSTDVLSTEAVGAAVTPDTASTPTSIAESAAAPVTVAATDTAAQDTTVLAETVAATDTPTQAETVAATETTALSETVAIVESATTIAETSASAPVASPSAPATTAPVVAQATPTIDPETGLYELPLDTGQSGAGSVTEGSQAPIRISRSEPMRNPDMQMLTAWSAYQQGDYAAARILYQQLLARDPDNRDALLGVAASAMQQGDMVSARQTYNRLLNLNPRDALARTGLLETTTASDPVQRETDLKALQTDHPEIAAVSYSLGNLYASQQRWHDAQQAYYEALLTARTQAEGPVSPDYAFNLAISLERINQPEAALNFYREALALSVQHVPGFDMNILDQRLRALERSQP